MVGAEPRPLFVPVILGTVRQGRMSQQAARLMVAELAKRPNVQTELVDIAALPLPTDNAGGSHQGRQVFRDDESGCLKEYIHKAVGIAGVSAGPFGGTRGIQDLLPVLRELGLVTIFWDVNFGNVRTVFDSGGQLLETAFLVRIDQFLKELIWMAKTLRHGREHIALE